MSLGRFGRKELPAFAVSRGLAFMTTQGDFCHNFEIAGHPPGITNFPEARFWPTNNPCGDIAGDVQ
jgi:hypothetical protein